MNTIPDPSLFTKFQNVYNLCVSGTENIFTDAFFEPTKNIPPVLYPAIVVTNLDDDAQPATLAAIYATVLEHLFDCGNFENIRIRFYWSGDVEILLITPVGQVQLLTAKRISFPKGQ